MTLILPYHPESLAHGAAIPVQSVATAVRPSPLTIRTIDEIEAYTPPEGDLILTNGYLAKGERTVILGQGGIGKSRLVLQLALCCCAGLPFLDIDTDGTGLKFLFLQAENGNRRLKHDVASMRAGFTGEQWARIKEGVFIHTLEQPDDGMLLLNNPEHFARVAAAIQERDPDVIVMDPLREAHGGDLNKDSEMTDTCRNLMKVVRVGGRTDRALIVLHHAKTGSGGIAKTTGYDRADFGRNSKVLQGWARAQINVAPGNPDNGDVLVIASGKNNNFREFKPFAARLNPDTMLYSVDPSFDMDEWASSVRSGAKQEVDIPVAMMLEILNAEGGRMEKKALVAAIHSRLGGVGQRRIEDAVAALLGGPIWEVKVPRSGSREAVYVELKPHPSSSGVADDN